MIKHQYIKYLACLLLIQASLSCRAQLSFNKLDSLFAYANRNSTTFKTASQQSLLAKWTKVAALANTINFRSPLSFSATDNMLLPVNFIPAEIFGGPAGSFRPITLGQEYVSNFNLNPQLDIINPYNWARVKSADLNKQLTEVNNLLNKKTLYESIASTYYNSVSIQEQIEITTQSLLSADSITNISRSKFEQGIIREQDLNNAKMVALAVQDKLQQLKISLIQQLNSLKVLCDIPAATQLNISGAADEETKPVALKAAVSLQGKYYALQSQYAANELRANRMSMLPVLSLVYYQGLQKNSNTSFTDANASWIQSRYLGLRLTVPFPPDVNKLSQSYTSRVNARIADLNTAHYLLQNELNNRSLELDYEKSVASFGLLEQISALKNTNYNKSLSQYKEGILPTDNLLAAFSDLLNSRLSLSAAKAAMAYNQSKISINNLFK